MMKFINRPFLLTKQLKLVANDDPIFVLLILKKIRFFWISFGSICVRKIGETNVND